MAGALLIGFGAVGACHPPPPACPRGDVCLKLAVVEPLRQTREGQLGCPMYISWGQDGRAADAPFSDLAPIGEATLDHEVTRAKHTSGKPGVSDQCCYHWYRTCPSP
jgi:hypothetical protein